MTNKNQEDIEDANIIAASFLAKMALLQAENRGPVFRPGSIACVYAVLLQSLSLKIAPDECYKLIALGALFFTPSDIDEALGLLAALPPGLPEQILAEHFCYPLYKPGL